MRGILQMHGLLHHLRNQDFGYLRIVAELWGVEIHAPDARQAAEQLAPILLDRALAAEMVEALPGEAQAALAALRGNASRLSWPLFTRRFGAVREMGPGRRDRERPYLDPVSPAEILWYRALVARAFFDTPAGPEEFAYIPEDLVPLLPNAQAAADAPLGRPANPAERAQPQPAGDRILDDACTLLAALRLGLSLDGLADTWITPPLSPYPLSPPALQSLLAAAGLLDIQGQPQPEPARLFLEAGRGAALAQLARAWLDSPTFNELALIPGLSLEGGWENDPARARRAVLDFLSTVPARSWWNLDAFVAAVRQHSPDFQRPAGDYDSWFIRDQQTGEYLRGFENWEAVDGALIRFIITGPLHWLGILDLAAPAEGSPASAFRFSDGSAALLRGSAPEGFPREEQALQARSDARLSLPRLVPRSVRYQIARFCEWEGLGGEAYRYRLTAASLDRARRQGLRAAQLLVLLRRHAAAVPPALIKALERWEERGTEARLEPLLVLRLSSPEILQELRASRAARFLGDPLGPTAVIVRAGAREKVLAALAEMGYLAEVSIEN
jgi:hypothetical protein